MHIREHFYQSRVGLPKWKISYNYVMHGIFLLYVGHLYGVIQLKGISFGGVYTKNLDLSALMYL